VLIFQPDDETILKNPPYDLPDDGRRLCGASALCQPINPLVFESSRDNRKIEDGLRLREFGTSVGDIEAYRNEILADWQGKSWSGGERRP
jgi:hypothetical protein